MYKPIPPPFDPMDYLGLAQQLASQKTERNLRCAVGRSYYAVFLVLRERLGVVEETNVHAHVIRKVRAVHGATASQWLFQLHRLRRVADYELVPSVDSDYNWEHNWVRHSDVVEATLHIIKDFYRQPPVV